MCGKLRLFVAGTSESNPDKWSMWDEISLVLAESTEQVYGFTNKRPVVEVDTSKPCLLCSLSEPNFGEDL